MSESLSLGQSIINNVLFGTIENVKKKPVLFLHFLVALFLSSFPVFFSSFILLLIRYFEKITHITSALIFLNILEAIIPIPVPMFTFFTMVFLINWVLWRYIDNAIDKTPLVIPEKLLKELQSSFYKFANKTIYDYFTLKEMKQLTSLFIIVVISYYGLWIIGLYITDTLCLILFKISYYSYILQNPAYAIIPFLSSIIVAPFVNLWPETRIQKEPKTANIRRLIERFITLRPPRIERKHSTFKEVIWEIFFNYILKISTPIPIIKIQKIVFDVIQLRYSQNTKQKIEEMIQLSGTYSLKPLNKNKCRSLKETAEPTLSDLCWYEVHVDGQQKGYALIMAIASEKSIANKESITKCLNKVRKNIERECQDIGDIILKDLEKLYFIKEGIILIFLVGKEELLGLRYYLFQK